MTTSIVHLAGRLPYIRRCSRSTKSGPGAPPNLASPKLLRCRRTGAPLGPARLSVANIIDVKSADSDQLI
jgi:hypothetical protein